MAFPTYSIIPLTIFMIFFTGFGSALRIVSEPEPLTLLTKKLEISCTTNEPTYISRSVISMQILRHIEDQPIASINMRQELKKAAGIKENVKAEGYIGIKSNTSYLTLTIDTPNRQDAGPYKCKMFYVDEDFMIVEKYVIGNVTYQESDLTEIITDLTRHVSNLLKTILKQNQTIQIHTEQHKSFDEFHSKKELDMNLLKDRIDAQNTIIVGQRKELEELKYYISKHNQDMDALADRIEAQNYTFVKHVEDLEYKDSKRKQDMELLMRELDRQKNTGRKLTEQNKNLKTLIEKLNTDNTQKQQQLDIVSDYIARQNTTIWEHQALLLNISHQCCPKPTTPITTPTTPTDNTTTPPTATSTSGRTGCPDGWTFYTGDKTCLKVFGKDNRDEYLTWSKARESCQTFGGDLVIIRDQDKNNFVFEMYVGSRYGYPWIGVKNQASRGYDWKYVDGSALGSHHPWYPGDPTGGQSDDLKCVYMSYDKSDHGQWRDDYCSDSLPYVCST